MIGLPGDSIYFYGGRLYGVDKEGNPLDFYKNSPAMASLEYIPFMSFEGEVKTPSNKEYLFYQNNLPIGKLNVAAFGELTGYVFNGKEWVKDNPFIQKKNITLFKPTAIGLEYAITLWRDC